jgi:hypothetical protein
MPDTPPPDPVGDPASEPPARQRVSARLLVFGALGGWVLTTLTDPATAIEVLAALWALVPHGGRG